MKQLHSFLALSALALALLLVPAVAAAQQQGTVYLNDGSVLSGQVVEFVPGDHITLQIGGTAPIVIPQASIARVEMGQTAVVQPYAPQPVQPQPYAVPQQTQPYQLQAPGTQPYGYAPQAPPRRRPGLGLPITFLSVGAVMLISGGVLISASSASDTDYYYESSNNLLLPGITLAAAGGIFLGLGVLFLVIRLKQRRNWSREQQAQPQYSFAPIISPERSHYGFQGVLNF